MLGILLHVVDQQVTGIGDAEIEAWILETFVSHPAVEHCRVSGIVLYHKVLEVNASGTKFHRVGGGV